MLRISLICAMLLFVVSACNTEPEVVLPTLRVVETAAVESDVEATTAETSPEATGPESVEATVAPSETPRPAGRPTLPPTWTPIPIPTDTPEPTQAQPTETLFVPERTIPAECDSLAVVLDQTTVQFPIGTAPTITWVDLPSAAQYRIILRRADGLVIDDQIYVDTNTYTFDANLFRLGQFYGWNVLPLDSNLIQYCYALGGELIPFRPLGG